MSALRLFFQIIEIIPHSSLIGTGDLILIQRGLGFALGGGGGVLETYGALAFDADAFQIDARHRTARGDLALQFSWRQSVGQLRVAAIGQAFRRHVGTLQAGIVPELAHFWI